MRKIRTLVKLSALTLLILFYSCEKEKNDSGFKEVTVIDLRVNNPSPSIELIDVQAQITAVTFPGPPAVTINDTLGLTKVSCADKLIFSAEWQVGYQSQFHYKTTVYAAINGNIQIIFVRSGIFFDKMFVIENNNLIKSSNFSTVTIKKIELNEIKRVIQIVSNSTWMRTGPIADVKTTIDY